MKKTNLKRVGLEPLSLVKGGVVPIVFGTCTLDVSVWSSAGNLSRSTSELGLTSVEQQ
jgi:hypothetical protein